MIEYIPSYIIYLIFLRSLIILTGAMCIFLGYRLFHTNIQSSDASENNTSLDASFGKNKLSLKNAAPGTCFAAFGAFLIITMLFASPPEMTFEQMNTSQERTVKTSGSIRGQQTICLYDITQKGVDYEKNNDIQNAKKVYKEAVDIISNPINLLAWQYYKQNELDKALSAADIAVRISPDNANCIDTLAKIYSKKGNKDEAKRLIKRYKELNNEE